MTGHTPNLNLRQLRTVDAVCRLGSFADAARALHMTPAAVSIAVRDLERSLGFSLFDRTTRSVRLSQQGRQFHPSIERILRELQAAERSAADLRSGAGAIVRIATTQTVISCLLPVAFRSFSTLWPGARLYTLDVPSGEIASALLTDQADIAIGVQTPDDDAFESHPLFTSRWTGFVNDEHPLARRRQVSWRQIATTPLIFINPSGRLRIEAGLPKVLKLESVYVASTASAALAMAASGQGMAVVPGYARPAAQVHQLHAVQIASPVLTHQVSLGLARRHGPSSPVRQLAGRLLAEVPVTYRHLR